MTTGNPLISIITVTFNAVDTIGRTMDSVASQTETNYEHLIMDGVSRDSTLSVVERTENPRVRIFSSADHGIYDAMNKAMGVARGEYYIFLNAGDTFADADTLARFARAINSDPRPGIVYGQTLLVDNDGSILGKRHLTAPKTLTLNSFRNGMTVCHQAMAVKREIAPLRHHVPSVIRLRMGYPRLAALAPQLLPGR